MTLHPSSKLRCNNSKSVQGKALKHSWNSLIPLLLICPLGFKSLEAVDDGGQEEAGNNSSYWYTDPRENDYEIVFKWQYSLTFPEALLRKHVERDLPSVHWEWAVHSLQSCRGTERRQTVRDEARTPNIVNDIKKAWTLIWNQLINQ